MATRKRIEPTGDGSSRAGELEARALAALEARDPAAAVEYYRQAVALCPLNPGLRASMGDALLLLARAKGPRGSRASGIPLPDDDIPAPAESPRRASAASPAAAPPPRASQFAPPPPSRPTPTAAAPGAGARPMSSRVRGLFEDDDADLDDDPVGLDFGPVPRPGARVSPDITPPMARGARPTPPLSTNAGMRPPQRPVQPAPAPSFRPAPAPTPTFAAASSPRVLRRESTINMRLLVVALLVAGALLLLAGAVVGGIRSLLREAALPMATTTNMPADVTAALDDAQSHLLDRQPEKAIAVLDQAAARHPGHAAWFADAQGRAWRAKGNGHRLDGEFEKAIAAFEKAAELDPDSADNWIDLARAREASAGRLGSRNAAAAAKLRQAAADAYAKATEAAPQSAVAWFDLGEARAAIGDREGAMAAWRKASATAPDADAGVGKAARERLAKP